MLNYLPIELLIIIFSYLNAQRNLALCCTKVLDVYQTLFDKRYKVMSDKVGRRIIGIISGFSYKQYNKLYLLDLKTIRHNIPINVQYSRVNCKDVDNHYAYLTLNVLEYLTCTISAYHQQSDKIIEFSLKLFSFQNSFWCVTISKFENFIRIDERDFFKKYLCNPKKIFVNNPAFFESWPLRYAGQIKNGL